MNAEQQYEQRCHERPAADSGHPDQQANGEPRSRIQQLRRKPSVHRGIPGGFCFDGKPTLICKSPSQVSWIDDRVQTAYRRWPEKAHLAQLIYSAAFTPDVSALSRGAQVQRRSACRGELRVSASPAVAFPQDALPAILRAPCIVVPWRFSVRAAFHAIVDLVSQVIGTSLADRPCKPSLTIPRKNISTE
jgi:hypothetical protein